MLFIDKSINGFASSQPRFSSTFLPVTLHPLYMFFGDKSLLPFPSGNFCSYFEVCFLIKMIVFAILRNLLLGFLSLIYMEGVGIWIFLILNSHLN